MLSSERSLQVQIIKELRDGGLETAHSKEVKPRWSPTWIDGHEKVSFTGPPPVTKRHSNRRIIKGQGKLRSCVEKGRWRLQCQENKRITAAIRKLDKATLNMYTSVRAGLGTRELSLILL